MSESCAHADCVGARLEGEHCLEHLTPVEFDAAVTRLRNGAPLQARNTTLSAERLRALLDALCVNEHPVLPAADFQGATLTRGADFHGATFSSYADFEDATFGDIQADFDGVTFSDDANFEGATFRGAGFYRATFRSDACFVGATFSDHADFRESTFSRTATFYSATFSRDANFARATFEHARELGPMSVGLGPMTFDERLVLDDCVFLERIRLDVTARGLSARGTTFAAGALMRVGWAEIALDNADFARPSTLSAAPDWDETTDLPPVRADDHLLGPAPRLVTLRGAHVAALSISNVDLRACRFFGAHGLESLTIEAGCRWPRAPSGRRYADRETIAEEYSWRHWNDPNTQPSVWFKGDDDTDPLTPTQIAGLYRALRKAREDAKDHAGASDLYYGEMEMRRHAAPTWHGLPRGDRALLRLYWLTSGYGLRPARTLAALATTLLVGAGLLCWFGFHDPRTYGRSLLFAIESSISLLRPPETKLSAGGEIVQITLRLLGPLLFGLALLAIRARIKR